MFKITLITLFIILFPNLAYGQDLVQDESRVYLKKGESAFGIEFDKSHSVLFNGKTLMLCNDSDGTEPLEISKPTPKKGLSLVLCPYQDVAFIVDTKSKKVLTKDIVPKNEEFGNFVSSSPDERYFITVKGGEGICIIFFIFDLTTQRARELRMKDCGSDLETNDFNEKNFSWLNNTSFQVRMDIHCSPYEDINCEPAKVIRSYNAQANVVTATATYGTAKTRTTRPLTKKSTVLATAELFKQLLQDDASARDCLRESYGGNESKLFQKFKVKRVDLNNDGQAEYIVEANDYNTGTGQGECFGDWREHNDIWVYAKVADGYEQLLPSVFSLNLQLLKTMTKGYRNLKSVSYNSTSMVETTYKFDGNRYKAVECLTYEYVETRKGGGFTKLVGRDDCSGN